MYEASVRSFLKTHNYPRFALKAVLFDMDGVLFDSMPLHSQAWIQAFKEWNIPFTDEEAYLHEGRTGSGTINIVFQQQFGREATPEEIKAIYTRKSALFDQAPQAPVMEGANELLDAVRDSALDRILVTGSGQKVLLSSMGQFFPGHFGPEAQVTAYDVQQGKPHPEPYLKGLQKAGAQAWEAIVIETAPLGIESAKSAGLFTVAVNTGKLDDRYLVEAGADVLFHGIPALVKAWPVLFNDLQYTSIHPSKQRYQPGL